MYYFLKCVFTWLKDLSTSFATALPPTKLYKTGIEDITLNNHDKPKTALVVVEDCVNGLLSQINNTLGCVLGQQAGWWKLFVPEAAE